MIRFSIVGGGWRAKCFLNAALKLPGELQVTGVYLRSPEKAAQFAKEYHVPVFNSMEALYRNPGDFTLNAGGYTAMAELSGQLLHAGIPVLSETPPAHDLEALEQFWDVCENAKVPFMVAEQCFARPYHRAIQAITDSGILGGPVDVTISMLHGYHGISIIRRLLQAGMESATITAVSMTDRVLRTCDRGGLIKNGKIEAENRQFIVFAFESGKSAVFDFVSEQYFSQLRGTSLRLRCDRGEIANDDVRYVSPQGDYLLETLRRVDLGHGGNLEGYSHRGITFAGQYIYKNPYAELCPLSDDEIAMLDMLFAMGALAKGAPPLYPMSDAFQDAYLANLMDLAIKTGLPQTAQYKAWSGR